MTDYEAVLDKQKEYYRTGETLPVAFRKEMLMKLKDALKTHEDEIIEALGEDLGKSDFEAYATEIGIVYGEIGYLLKHLSSFMRKKRVASPITIFKASSYTIADPMGSVLIMSPWNYPLQLTMVPLAGAIAGGNTAIVKPSRYSKATSALMKRIIDETFDERYIACFEGGHETNTALLELRYDLIFFTGSPGVGRIVAAKAAETLTPTVLELGGKSPVIVDESADVRLTARRLAWAKYLNAGQTCVAPDYVLAAKGMAEPLIEAMRKEIERMFSSSPLTSPDLPKMINERHYERVKGLISGSVTAIGGKADDGTRKIEPTVLYPVRPSDPVMQEEIFGPVLPVLEYESLDEAIDFIRDREKPLALYIFSRTERNIEKIHALCSFGGGCVNDAVIHLTNPRLPFGGVGNSGMGAYHGKKSLETFTHRKSIIREALWIDVPVRYAPFRNKIKLLRLLMR